MQLSRICAINDDTVACAVELIRAGEVVVIPTDTVYGVVADPCNLNAVQRIFDVKHRPRDKTVQILAADLSDISRIGVTIPQELSPIVEAFMPGALSVIGNLIEPDNSGLVTARAESAGWTQAVRLPAYKPALDILRATGPLAASSANLSGSQAACTALEAYEQLGESVSLYLDGGPTPGPVPSTVVAWDEQNSTIEFLRDGVVLRDDIYSAMGL